MVRKIQEGLCGETKRNFWGKGEERGDERDKKEFVRNPRDRVGMRGRKEEFVGNSGQGRKEGAKDKREFVGNIRTGEELGDEKEEFVGNRGERKGRKS